MRNLPCTGFSFLVLSLHFYQKEQPDHLPPSVLVSNTSSPFQTRVFVGVTRLQGRRHAERVSCQPGDCELDSDVSLRGRLGTSACGLQTGCSLLSSRRVPHPAFSSGCW